jgi:hypothetical protein
VGGIGIEKRWVGLKAGRGGDEADEVDEEGPQGCRVSDRWNRVTGAASSGVVDTSESETDLPDGSRTSKKGRSAW